LNSCVYEAAAPADLAGAELCTGTVHGRHGWRISNSWNTWCHLPGGYVLDSPEPSVVRVGLPAELGAEFRGTTLARSGAVTLPCNQPGDRYVDNPRYGRQYNAMARLDPETTLRAEQAALSPWSANAKVSP
jgi:hypothetical protein